MALTFLCFHRAEAYRNGGRVKLGRWVEVTESEYPWEREALGYLRERLPDTEPFRAWLFRPPKR